MAWRKHFFEGAEAVILDSKGKVLLEKRSDVLIWNLPGGEKLRNESPKKTVIRELKEETGLNVKIIRYVGSYHSNYLSYHDTTHLFLCKISSGKLKKNYEAKELGFFEINKLPRLLLYLHKKRILDAVVGKENIKKQQKVTLWKVLKNFNFNPFLLWQLAKFSLRRIL